MRWLGPLFLFILIIIHLGAGTVAAAQGNKDRFCQNALRTEKHFQIQIKQLESRFKAETKDIDKLIDILVDTKARLDSYEFLALADMYYHRDPNIRKIFVIVKEFESALGRFRLSHEIYKSAKKARFPKPFRKWLKAKYEQNREEFKQYLIDAHWFGKDREPFEKIRKWLSKVEFRSEEKENKFILRSLLKELEDTSEEIEEVDEYVNVDIEDFDWDNMENGPHEMRRRVREKLMHLLAVKNLFYLEPMAGALDDFDRQLLREFADDHYLGFPVKAKSRIPIPQMALLQASYIIETLGDIKQKGEAYFYLIERWKKYQEQKGNNISYREARDYVEKKIHIRSIQRRSQALLIQYNELQPLHDIILNIEEALAEKEAR